MGRPELADSERYATHKARGEHQAELDDLIAEWTLTQSPDALQQLMDEYGVPAGQIYTAKEMLADPHFAAREAIVGVSAPGIGEIKMQNVFPKLSDTPGGIDWAGPELGEHNEYVLSGLLGMKQEEVDALRAKKVI
jgi:succinyl-CoA--D-citramalate CoA-transferase